MNPKVTKFVSKIGTSIAAAVLIGYTIKAERKANVRIDEHFDNTEETEEVSDQQ